MATSLAKLRARAKKLRIPATQIRSAGRDELESMIEDAEEYENGKPRKKVVRKKASRKGVVRKAVRKSATKSAPAKSTKARKGTAKRQTTRKTATRKTTKASGNSNGYQAKGGRNVLEDVDYSPHEDWNPRPGSAPDRIIRAMRKFRGNREKVYEFLLPDIDDFVKPKRADGSKWEKGDVGTNTRRGMLKYRIARTAWQFAVQTDQHDKATNRVEYGTGGTGAGIYKPNKRRATPQKATRGPGRPRKAQTKARATPKRTTAQKPAQRRAVRKTSVKATSRKSAARKPVRRR
jgi:hypothetical protein